MEQNTNIGACLELKISKNVKDSIYHNAYIEICATNGKGLEDIMSKEELFHVFFIGWIMKKIGAIPVKRTGSDLTAIKHAFKTVNGGEILGIFPTGQREKVKGEGEVKSGVGLIAGKTKAPIIPIHIGAGFKPFSKVVVNIGRCEVFAPSEGEKINAEMAEVFSKEIYKKIKDLA
jgi:1-acyl-sn-glycerol-3-phosphate acyltransferase